MTLVNDYNVERSCVTGEKWNGILQNNVRLIKELEEYTPGKVINGMNLFDNCMAL